MNYGREVLLGNAAERAMFTGGLATPDVATRGGVFGPQGYGGGIFDGSTALSGTRSGLGVDDSRMPWKEYSEYTGDVQGQLNARLHDAGYCPIPVDGYLGPVTCGAALEVAPDLHSTSCQSHKPPRLRTDGCPGSPKGSQPGKPDTEIAPPGPSTGNLFWIGAGVAALGALGVGGYVLWKKRRRRR